MNFVGLSDTSWIVLMVFLAAVVLYLVCNGIRIRHPERSHWSILTFVVVTFLIPPASLGLAYLSYQNGVSIIPAVELFVILSGLGFWYLRRTIRRPPKRSRKAVGGTVEQRSGSVEQNNSPAGPSQAGGVSMNVLDALVNDDRAVIHTVTFDGGDGLVCEWIFNRCSVDNHSSGFGGDPRQLDTGPYRK